MVSGVVGVQSHSTIPIGQIFQKVTMNYSQYFSPNYKTARERFRSSIDAANWSLESHQLDVLATDGSDLSIDIGLAGQGERAIVISSGLHGVEGYLGAAIQLAWLEALRSVDLSSVRLVFIHALNPYGFAERRRWNEDGVDLNRNFLLSNESFSGSPAEYRSLDPFFNPATPPPQRELFLLQALGWAARYGAQGIKKTLAIGQYEYPRGLFFGGHGPTQTQRILADNLTRWLDSSAMVTHVDFHTGLGQRATYRLFPKESVDSDYQARLIQRFGAESLEFPSDRSLSYPIRGGLGQWCQALLTVGGASPSENRAYDFVTAEFGTYPALQVLQALRAENRAHWYGQEGVDYSWTKDRLVEMFAPAAADWRESCVAQGLKICQQTMLNLRGSTQN
jgi:hypothetical protein